MSAEETVTYNVVYNVQGINESVRGTQRYLFFMNALRLSAQDIQQVMSGPTLQNVLWTTIQLTRAWTAFHRIVKATNQEQMKGTASGLLRSTAGRTGGRSLGQTMLTFDSGGNLGSVLPSSFLSVLAASLGIGTNALVMGAGVLASIPAAIYLHRRGVVMRNEDIRRQREIARSQGIEF